MHTLKFSRSRLIPDLTGKENKMIFLGINLALIIGGLSLVVTFLYLLANLQIADSIIIYCLPGFGLGISLVIVYYFGYRKLTNKRHPKRLFKKPIVFNR